MEQVLELQGLEASDGPQHGGSHCGGYGASNLSLLASCANSTISLLTCH